MGKLGEEVSLKIKSAIKAKLMELGIHIDNELPDYVMVLVANKKTQKQMEEDLSLFLGDCTVSFTTWLHNVLKKLEQVTITTKAKKKDKIRRRGVDDSNGVSSTKRVKAEQIEDIKTESQDGEKAERSPPPEPEEPTHKASIQAEEESENDDGVSLTDHAETRSYSNNEAESVSAVEEDVSKEQERVVDDKNADSRPRERIKIVWNEERSPDTSKDQERKRDKTRQSINKESIEKLKSQISKRIDRERDSRRSRSRSASRYGKKGLLREDYESRRSRNRSRDRYKKNSPSPRRRSSGEGKVVDARDILKRKGQDKKMAVTRRRDSRSRSPYSRTRSRSQEKEKALHSVLKAVIRLPEKPPPTIPSLVKVTPRPVRALQPTGNLILKAVADAEKSLASSKVNKKKQTETLKEDQSRKRRKRYDYEPKGNISITLLNDRVISSKSGVPTESKTKDDNNSDGCLDSATYEQETSQENIEEDAVSMAIDEDDYIDTFDKDDLYTMESSTATPVEEYRPLPIKKDVTNKKYSTDYFPVESEMKRFIISLDSTASDNENENELDTAKQNYEVSDDVSSTTVEPSPFEKSPLEPRTFDRSRLGPRIQIATSPTTDSSTSFSKNSAIPETLAEVQITRCKYYPNCESGDSCPFVHPSTPCRVFPNCHFGDKCLYIHPNCKFGDSCLNVKCPYSHKSKTPAAKASRPFLPISNPQTTCIYYPNCTKAYCPYQHPKKLCRYGSACMKLGCEFDHGNHRNPYKWVATSQI